MDFADLDSVVARAREAWRPPPRLSLSEWADRHFVMSAETSARPGQWRTLPYQREILDSISDPGVEQVTLIKSARVGYTLMLSAAMGYFMSHDPASIMVVQPAVDDAKDFSKETVAPMLSDVPVLAGLVERSKGPKDSSATLLHKKFPGGILSLVGANSGRGFRRVSRRIVMFDEVDAYPPSAGSEGDQIELGKKRAEQFHNRKFILGSTPLLADNSRIQKQFLEGDQRRYHVPCPHCGHMDILVFREGQRGHHMYWPEGKPQEACFSCRKCGCLIEHKHKRWMVERGEWRADKPGGKHRSYHIWAAYSYSPNATWGQIAERYIKAERGGDQTLKTFYNTELGETWTQRGEVPDWELLYLRRESYRSGTVPSKDIIFLTGGIDVQKDRLVYEIVGWTADKESYSIEAGVLPGDPALDATWDQVEELLAREFPGVGRSYRIAKLAVDSGYSAQVVYNWARRHPMSRVIATKGARGEMRALISAPSTVDVKANGKKSRRGYKVWIVGVKIAKDEFFGCLNLKPSEGEIPPGYCHFPADYGEDYFKQLTAEHLIPVTEKGRTVLRWMQIPNRENHYLDTRIYARAAASVAGLDRQSGRRRRKQPAATAPAADAPSSAAASPGVAPAPPPPPPPPAATPPTSAPRRASWLHDGRAALDGRDSWLSRRY